MVKYLFILAFVGGNLRLFKIQIGSIPMTMIGEKIWVILRNPMVANEGVKV